MIQLVLCSTSSEKLSLQQKFAREPGKEGFTQMHRYSPKYNSVLYDNLINGCLNLSAQLFTIKELLYSSIL